MIILMCDGSSKGNPGPCKIGVVAWKRIPQTHSVHKVTPTHRISKSIGHGTNNDAEWQACLEGVKWARENRSNPDEEIFLYTDSLLVVNQIKGEWKVKLPHIKIYREAYLVLSHTLNITTSWLPRQLTSLADKLT